MVSQLATLADLNAALEEAGDKLVVIDFFATWCGPCKMIAPKIEEWASSMDNVVFVKIDVDENEEAAQEYNISAMPTFILIKNKEKVKSAVVLPSTIFGHFLLQVADLMGANPDKLKELVDKHA